jgi:hypothetical protein
VVPGRAVHPPAALGAPGGIPAPSWRAIKSPLPPAWLWWRQVSYLSGKSARRHAAAFPHYSAA